MITSILNVLISTLESYQFLFIADIIAFSIKMYLLTTLVSYGLKSSKIQKSWFFLILVLTGSLVVDLFWIIKISQKLLDYSLDYRIITFIIRFAWTCSVIEYQSLAFFIESLMEKKFKLGIRRSFFLTISGTLSCVLLYLAIFDSHNAYDTSCRPKFEIQILSLLPLYLLFLLFTSLILTLVKLRKTNTPKILKRQLNILMVGLLCPRLISDSIQALSNFTEIYPIQVLRDITSNYAVVSASTLLLAYAAYYSTKKVMRLRFLNIRKQVQSTKGYNFINKFTDVLEQLSHAMSTQELTHITKLFFKDALEIPMSRTTLYIRKLDSVKTNEYADYNTKNFPDQNKLDVIESFISEDNQAINDFFKQSKILIYDDIDFSNFYEENEALKSSFNFLNQINADIFIPIYKKQTVIAYIIIERDTLGKQLYNNLERDEMIVFSSYLGNVINLLQNRNLDTLISQERELKEELYIKHQEINQYKESIRSFLKKNQQRKIGILFYKNRKFIYGNHDAKELIPININTQDGHTLTQDLKKVAKQVEDYKSGQTFYTKDPLGNKLVLTGVPNLENNNIIILIYYPDISDTIKQQIDLLKDPSKWDYLLYLETTKSGQLINQLIPGSGEVLLNFKMNLLKIALNRHAILLEMPEDDLTPTVEIIHHISLRENLHILKLQSQTKNFDIAVKLFGINPLFAKNDSDTKPILQKLDGVGTLFIQNIHFLDLETQEYLANFIRHGYFNVFKSDKKISSDVRIIASTNLNLKDLVQEGKFSKLLYSVIKNNLIMPSLLTLSEDELNNLVQGFSQQAITTNDFKNLLELTDKEKTNLINKRPASLQEFKTKIQHLLTEKSKKNNVYKETHFDPAYNITDPKLIEAARLGKHALKDAKLLALLWSKFKNQNKIATFLGVNRSSVHRRFKEYKIE